LLAFCTRTVDFFVVVITPFLSTIRIWNDEFPTLFLSILMAWAAAAGTDLTRIPSRYTCTVDCAGALTLSTTLLPTTLLDDGVNTACGATTGICEPSSGLTMRFTGSTVLGSTDGVDTRGCGIVDDGTIDSGIVDDETTRRAIVVVVSGATSSPPPPPPLSSPPPPPDGTEVVEVVEVVDGATVVDVVELVDVVVVVVGAAATGGAELNRE